MVWGVSFIIQSTLTCRLLGWLSGKKSACQFRRHRRRAFDLLVRKIPWRRKWKPTPVVLLKESHGQRSLAGCTMGLQRDRPSWACMHTDGINQSLPRQQQRKLWILICKDDSYYLDLWSGYKIHFYQFAWGKNISVTLFYHTMGTKCWVVLSEISPINYNMIDNYWAFTFPSFFKFFFYKQSLVHIPSIPRACMHAMLLQSCLTLCDPMDCSLPDSSVHGSLQARILEWVAMPFSRGSSWPRGRIHISYTSSVGPHVLYH